ncbi:MAG TPA: type II toxin-antitoxin system Phd/YefM family antitoxin [Pyrinomonadaceae bacterium]
MQKIVPITDLQRGAGQIVTDLADDSIIITHRGRAAAVLVSAKRYAEMETDLERLDELELAGMVEEARRVRASEETLSHDEVKRRLKKRAAERPRRARRGRK